MGDIVFGIYGFDFCQPRTVEHVDLVPLFQAEEARRRGADSQEFYLTGYGRFAPSPEVADEPSRHHVAMRLADAMTFLQQQHVVLTRLIQISPADDVEVLVSSGRLPDSLPSLQERPTSGALLMGDGFSTQSRTALLQRFVTCVMQSSTRPSPLVGAMYRQVEIWRLWSPLVELQHFLAFSALEILGRAFGPSPDNPNAAVPISGYLRNRGFDVPQTLAEEWAAARNGAFHRGQITIVSPSTGKSVDVADQLYALETILADACLKELGFVDPHINWNRWKDRMAFC